MLLLIAVGWLLIGWAWGFMTVNRRAFQGCLEDRYWGIISMMILNHYRHWILEHPGITAVHYHENKWNELRQNAVLSPEAREDCERFINFVCRAVLLQSLLLGPIAILVDLKDRLRQRNQPKLT